jgi:hypothetical protein
MRAIGTVRTARRLRTVLTMLALPACLTAQRDGAATAAPLRFLRARADSAAPVLIDPSRVPVLQQHIALAVHGLPLREALRQVAASSGLQFAYATDVLAADRVVDLAAPDITVAAALTSLLGGAGVQVVLRPGGNAVLVRAPVVPGPELRGIVLLPDSSRAAGAIVVAADERGNVAGRALTGERGEFDLRLPAPGRYEVRVLRIGFKPTVVPAIELAAGEVRSLSVVLRGEAVTLAAVTVRGTNDCRVRADSSHQVAAMWEEARKAIVATELTPVGARQTVEWTVYNRSTDITGDAVLSEERADYSAEAMKAFVSLPPDSLARVGYMSADASGTVYRAPDADALLSDAFAADHCFHVEPPTPDHGDWVGVGFRPAKDRGNIVDIAGTLWLDRASSELRRLEFHYTNLPPDDEHTDAGGHVEFLRLSTGSWLVSRWEIRMPRTTMKLVPTFNATLGARDQLKRVVEGLQFTGGEVTAVRRGSEVLFSSGHSAHDYSPALLADDARLALTCGADRVGDDLVALLRGTVIDDAHSPVPGASVRVTWRGAYRSTGGGTFSYRDERRDLTASASGEWFVCGIPRERIITVVATIGTRVSAPVTVLIPRGKTMAGVDVEVRPRQP